jgi:hypothetical protein
VVGDLEGGPPGRHQRPVAFDLLGVPGVQPAVLAGQQLVVTASRASACRNS